jgi:hypothetical protein
MIMNKINWPRLGKAAKDSILETLCVLFMMGIIFAPLVIAFITNCVWWFLIYAVGYLIMSTWEKYNGR